VIDLVRAADYVRLHRGRVLVIKVGGACLARPAHAAALARQLAVVEACGARPVVVHGGGPQTDAIARSLGEEPTKVEGRRVTTPVGLKALRWATCGELHADLAAAITRAGSPAVGFCAASGDCVVATRRPPTMTDAGVVDFGQVGDVVRVDPTPLLALSAAGRVPVVCPPASDGDGGFLNVNADLLAARLAIELEAAKLVLVTSAPGVLTDPADPGSVASTLALDDLAELARSGALEGGMRVKATAARTALEGGVERVHVVSGLEPGALLGELYTTHGTGTLLTRVAETAPAEALEGVSA